MARDDGAAVRAQIRSLHAAAGRRLAVLDDDPTGSQSVHDVDVVTSFGRDELTAALATPGACAFVLTNSRSEPERRARALNASIGRTLLSIARAIDAPIELVSRSDSTLRGHVLAELQELDAARRDAVGSGFDGVLFAPAFLEAGRYTEGDVHYARVGGAAVPVGETEFARDATFGYRASDLKEFLLEAGRGAIRREQIVSLELDSIRGGGAAWVAERLCSIEPFTYVVVNATTYDDLEQVALGVALAESDGRALLHRCGPSFVRALAGIDPIAPLTSLDLYGDAGPRGNGLVVAGSHVGLTNAQLAVARERLDLAALELDASACLDVTTRGPLLARLVGEVRDALATNDVLVSTSRSLIRGSTPEESLAIARAVSSALVEVVRATRASAPGWVLAKGGITSHDVAVHGLEIRRARVRGQLLPGMVSVLSPIDAPAEVLDQPFVVFAGNVGDETTLATVIETVRGDR